MTQRPPQADDNDNIKNLLFLLDQLCEFHPQYNNNDWCAVYMARTAIIFHKKYSYEEFITCVHLLVSHYKVLWDKEPK